MSKVRPYLDALTAQGKSAFTLTQFCTDLQVEEKTGLQALVRAQRRQEVASPTTGYYLILSPEFRKQRCLPADHFIDDLMQVWQTDYYVALLSSALYHGAAHHQPQTFQVMLQKKKYPIRCGHITIDFVQNSRCSDTPVQQVKTRTGYMKVSTPEATAMDMMNYMRQSGGIGRIATVLDELAETLSTQALSTLAKQFSQHTWIHRLGFLLDQLGHNALADTLHVHSAQKSIPVIPLVPYASMTGVPRDKKWHIAINANVASDLNDTT